VLKVRFHHYGCASLVAEVRPLQDGVQAANMAGYHNIIIVGDNQIIINALLGVISSPRKISTVINDVKFLLQHNNRTQFQVRHIFREANMASDWLSKSGHFHQLMTEDSGPLHREL